MDAQEGVRVLAELSDGICLADVDVNTLREQDMNARVMDDAKFSQLVANIKKRGTLEQLPFCAETGKGVEIVSGHHRVRAAKVAGLQRVDVLLDRSGLSRSSIAAKQLAHNAIEGVDDPDMLRKIAALITDVDDMLESALDEEYFEKAQAEIAALPNLRVDFDWKTVQFTFLPAQLQDLSKLCDKVEKADFEGVADIRDFECFVDALAKTCKFEDIRNVGTAVGYMVEQSLASLGVEDDAGEYQTAAKVFGRAVIPKETADGLKQLVSELQAAGKIENPWDLFAYVLEGKRDDGAA